MNREKLIEELIFDEGMIDEVYKDHLGYNTFGVGHLILDTDKECGQPVGTKVSKERIIECLNSDIDAICADLDRAIPWWRELDDDRQRVMANMGFNLGLTRLLQFKKKKLHLINISQSKTIGIQLYLIQHNKIKPFFLHIICI